MVLFLFMPFVSEGETHVISGYFMWREAGLNWENDMPRYPWLGDLDSQGRHLGYEQDDPYYIGKTLQWGQAHGVRVFAPVWRGKRDNWDSFMRTKLEVFRSVIQGSEYQSMQWCVFLGNVVANNTPPQLLDFGPPGSPTTVYNNFVDSLTTGLNMFGWLNDNKYLKIGGKPVVVVFRSRDFTGNFQGAVDEVRAYHSGNIYLIGMSGQWHKFFADTGQEGVDRVRAFDAVTAWSATAGSPSSPKDLQTVVNFIEPRLNDWKNNVTQLTTVGTGAPVDFGPTITCQYDKSIITGNDGPTRWARTQNDFESMVQMAKDNLDPNGIGGTGDTFVWLQTFNEWPEGTPCEPTELGLDYPFSHPEYQDGYGFEFLETLRDILHPNLKRNPREAILIAPQNAIEGTSTRPVFRWDEVDSNPAVNYYQLRIKRATNGAIVFDQNVGNVTTTVLPVGVLATNTEYTWEIRVHNTWSNPWSDWSREWSFKTGGKCAFFNCQP